MAKVLLTRAYWSHIAFRLGMAIFIADTSSWNAAKDLDDYLTQPTSRPNYAVIKRYYFCIINFTIGLSVREALRFFSILQPRKTDFSEI